jgi:hypothetical protein
MSSRKILASRGHFREPSKCLVKLHEKPLSVEPSTSRLASDEMSRLVQLAIEYDPRPPLGGIDWSTVDRDMLRPRVEGFAKEALGDHPDLLARLLG